MPQLDFSTFSSQIFWLAISFGLFYLIMARHAIPAIVQVRQHREERITGDLDKAESSREEAQHLENQYQSSVQEMANQSADVFAKAQETIASKSAQAHEKLAKDLADKTQAANELIDQIQQKAIEEVAASSAALSVKVIEKVADITVKEAAVKKAVQAAAK